MTVQTLAIVVLLVSFFVMIFLRFPIAYAVGLSSVFCMLVQGQAQIGRASCRERV